jgi:hypothetical protein
MYGFLADMVMLLHFGFILLATFGGLLALYWPRFALVHLPALLWALYIEFKPGTLCPLTPLEQTLRSRAGQPSYTEGFINHYLAPIIYPTNLTTQDQYFMGVALLLFTGIVYWGVYKRWRSARR